MYKIIKEINNQKIEIYSTTSYAQAKLILLQTISNEITYFNDLTKENIQQIEKECSFSDDNKTIYIYTNEKNLLFYKEDCQFLIHKIINYALKIKIEGLLSIEELLHNEPNKLLVYGLSLIIDCISLENLEKELNEKIKDTQKILFDEEIETAKTQMNIIKDGLISISRGENPHQIEDILKVYINTDEYKSPF